jgi:hypothetical protein
MSRVIRQVRHLAGAIGFRLKRKKETIAHNSKRMIATQLVVNAKLSLTNEKRSRIRAAVHSYASAAASTEAPSDRTYNRVSGQLAYLSQHHPSEGAELREQLRKARRRELEHRKPVAGKS